MKLSEQIRGYERLAPQKSQMHAAWADEAEALEKALLRAQSAVLLLQRRLGWVIDPAE